MLPGGPAAKSDLQIGDVVLEYQGQAIDRSSELPPLVGLTAPGKRAEIKLYRRDQGTQTITLLIGELKEDKANLDPPVPVKTAAAGNGAARLGLALSESNARQREKRDFGHGINVEGVEEGVAREAGLRPGDVILEVDGKRVHSVPEFNRLVAHTPKGRPALLRIRRGAQALFLTLRVPS
jgi:serine protease Do